MTAVKPRARRAEHITAEEKSAYHWLGRLSMCLAVTSHEMPPHLQAHVRKTLDEFISSAAATETLARIVRDEVKR